MRLFIFLTCAVLHISGHAQLKFVIEDFEGLSDGSSELRSQGIFSYGNINATIEYRVSPQEIYTGERFIRTYWAGKEKFGGWGKGITQYVELDPNTDYLNFYLYTAHADSFKVELQEDDNDNSVYDADADDAWISLQKAGISDSWQLLSIPINKFKDQGPQGDGIFNVGYHKGKLLSFIISFPGTPSSVSNPNFCFDFICLSQGKLPTGKSLYSPPPAPAESFCSLGIWSEEGNTGSFLEIATGFENGIKYGSEKKLGVVHFFQPFSVEGNSDKKHYPSPERINKVIQEGYIPMITLEDHFPNASPAVKQPNLYSIVEGHFDSFFSSWARQIKDVKGTVLLRILHEFNGDWYPWCIALNDHNPELLIKAYRHIHSLFKKEQVQNVKFVWCPNSISLPQASWNYILDAYPGNEYVDLVGLDVYNGAGKGYIPWRSFRKEGVENYFILTQKMPNKPLLICETASRERNSSEPKNAQDKAGWIKQMSLALTTDMSKIKLVTWFNEKETFRINSSNSSQGTFLDYILKNEHFKSGAKYLLPLLE